MPRLGIDLGGIDTQTFGAQWLAPEPGRHTFEIMDITLGTNKEGEHAGESYVMAKCVQTDGEDPGTRTHSQYLGLSPHKGQWGIPLAKTKGFLEAIGRQDIIAAGADADLDDMIGTLFEAEVTFSTSKKTGKENSNLSAIVPLSHAAGLAATQTTLRTDETPPTPSPAVAPSGNMRRGR